MLLLCLPFFEKSSEKANILIYIIKHWNHLELQASSVLTTSSYNTFPFVWFTDKHASSRAVHV